MKEEKKRDLFLPFYLLFFAANSKQKQHFGMVEEEGSKNQIPREGLEEINLGNAFSILRSERLGPSFL
jgi:hypothetical protein